MHIGAHATPPRQNKKNILAAARLPRRFFCRSPMRRVTPKKTPRHAEE
jgi:hypothetical protein